MYKGEYHINKNFYAYKSLGGFDCFASRDGVTTALTGISTNKICTHWCYVDDLCVHNIDFVGQADDSTVYGICNKKNGLPYFDERGHPIFENLELAESAFKLLPESEYKIIRLRESDINILIKRTDSRDYTVDWDLLRLVFSQGITVKE